MSRRGGGELLAGIVVRPTLTRLLPKCLLRSPEGRPSAAACCNPEGKPSSPRVPLRRSVHSPLEPNYGNDVCGAKQSPSLGRTAVPHRRCPKSTSSRFNCQRSISNQPPSATATRSVATVSYLDWGSYNLTPLPRYNSLDRSIVLCMTVKVDSYLREFLP